MNNISPNILFRTQFYEATPGNRKTTSTWKTKRAYYTCNSTSNILDYLNRESAVDQTFSDKQLEQAKNLKSEGFSDKDILNYISARPGSGGLFCKSGMMTLDQVKQAQEQMRITDSIIWDSFISFETEYGKKNCNTNEKALNIMQKNLPELFKGSHLNYNNIEWFASLHTNTNNYHIQFVFFEKEPMHLKKTGDLTFTKKGKIAEHNFNKLKLCIEKDISLNNDSSFIKRNELKSSFGSAIKTQKEKGEFGSKLQNLSNILPNKGRLSYDSENMKDLKPFIDEITTYLIKNDFEVNKTYKEYKKAVGESKKEISSLYKNNNIAENDKLKNYVKDRISDVYRRLGNIAINTTIEIRKENKKHLTTKTFNKNTRAYRNNKKRISVGKATSQLLAVNSYKEESKKAVNNLRKKLEEAEELEIQKSKLIRYY